MHEFLFLIYGMKLFGICFKQVYSTLNKTIVLHITQYKSYFDSIHYFHPCIACK